MARNDDGTERTLHRARLVETEEISVASGTTAPPGIDPTVPSTARMYDFWLDGKDHFAVDRTAALEVSEAAPRR